MCIDMRGKGNVCYQIIKHIITVHMISKHTFAKQYMVNATVKFLCIYVLNTQHASGLSIKCYTSRLQGYG